MQFKGGEQLVDAAQFAKAGTLLVTLEPLWDGGLDDLTPRSSCIANAYSDHHEEIASGNLSAVDAVGLIHALLLRIQAAILPIKQLIFSGRY